MLVSPSPPSPPHKLPVSPFYVLLPNAPTSHNFPEPFQPRFGSEMNRTAALLHSYSRIHCFFFFFFSLLFYLNKLQQYFLFFKHDITHLWSAVIWYISLLRTVAPWVVLLLILIISVEAQYVILVPTEQHYILNAALQFLCHFELSVHSPTSL